MRETLHRCHLTSGSDRRAILRRTAGLLEVPRIDQLAASREECREEEIPGDGAEEIVVDHNRGEGSS